MKRLIGIAIVLLFWQLPSSANAGKVNRKPLLDQTNAQLHGVVLDFTKNHGEDRRIWSEALHKHRDMYVYLPPDFDPHQRYPLLLWLHGFAQDELSFLQDVIIPIDRAITEGQLPRLIVATPDGSLDGEGKPNRPGSFFMNSKAGNYEDYLMGEVWPFLLSHFPILPERQAHVVAGVSMGGNAAFNKAIKFRDCFMGAAGIFPPLNVRWEDCHGRYKGNFDPCCWGWRTNFRNCWEVVARFGFVKVRQGRVVGPLFGRKPGPEEVAVISRENPIEMLDAYDVRPGQVAMYIGYCGKDEFNVDAQVESFLYRAGERGLKPEVVYYPEGHHDLKSAYYFFPTILDWFGRQLACYKGVLPRATVVPVNP